MTKRETVQMEWLALTVASWSKWNHYRLTTPDWEHTAVRRGTIAGVASGSSGCQVWEAGVRAGGRPAYTETYTIGYTHSV